MEPAKYQIPLLVAPPRQYPWQRLHMSATHSSAARARAVPVTYARGRDSQEAVGDSLDWTLTSRYDHENDLFIDKSAALRRPGVDKRRCQREQNRIVNLRNTTAVLEAELESEALQKGRAGMANINTSRIPSSSATSDSQWPNGPKKLTIRTRDSLATSLIYSPRPTHMLTVPKVTPGYARNPSGAFFTS